MKRTCEFTDYITNKRCSNKATTYRKSWGFGDPELGEPQIKDLRFYYCKECAKIIDKLVKDKKLSKVKVKAN
jgi:hypothetical protein